MGAVWNFGLVDSAGTKIGDGLDEAKGIKLGFQRVGPAICQCWLPLTSTDAQLLAGDSVDAYVKGYRQPEGGGVDDRVLRFYGPVWVDEVVGEDSVDQLVITALDPLVYLTKRYTNAQYAVQDMGTTLKAMVDTSNSTDGDTGIRTDSGLVTASATADFDLRTNFPTIDAMRTQMSDMLDGPDSWITPTEYAAGKIGDLYIAPSRGGLNTEPVFGYGNGTAANCRSMGRVRDKSKIENDSRAFSETLTGNKLDATSIAAIKRMVGYTSMTGETSQATMDARAQGRIDQLSSRAKVAEYRAKPSDDAPQLFDDFDIADIVRLVFRKGVSWDVQQRVESAVLSISDVNRMEQLEAIEFRPAA